MTEKGQFYLIVALIMIAIIAGLIVKLNLARVNPQPLPFTELSANFEVEAMKVIDRGVYDGDSILEIQADLEAFASDYTEYASMKSSQIGFLYIFGHKGPDAGEGNITVVNFLLQDAKVKISPDEPASEVIGGSALTLHRLTLEVGEEKFVRDFEVKAKEFKGINLASGTGEFIELNIGGIPYNIAIAKGIDFTALTIQCDTTPEGLEECYVKLLQKPE